MFKATKSVLLAKKSTQKPKPKPKPRPKPMYYGVANPVVGAS